MIRRPSAHGRPFGARVVFGAPCAASAASPVQREALA